MTRFQLYTANSVPKIRVVIEWKKLFLTPNIMYIYGIQSDRMHSFHQNIQILKIAVSAI